MKHRRALIIILVGTLLALTNHGVAQTATDWGTNVAGLQIAISPVTNAIWAGSSTIVEYRATNTSDGLIIFALDPHLDTQINLVRANTNYDLSIFKPNGFRPGGGPGYGVGPHKMESYHIPITIPTNAAAGIYQLTASIKIRIRDSTLPTARATFPEVQSRPIELKIR